MVLAESCQTSALPTAQPADGSITNWQEVRGLDERAYHGAREKVGRVDELELSASNTGVSTVVRVAGEVDLLTASRFEEFLLDQLAGTHTVLMLDLADVTYLGSAGLSVLLSVRRECERRRVDLVLGQCSRIVLRAFEVSGTTEVFFGDDGTAHRQSS